MPHARPPSLPAASTVPLHADGRGGRRGRYHHGDLPRALTAAARRLLEAIGPARLSLRGVARAAGVTPAAPYYHFRDKAQLLEAVARQGWTALGEAIETARRTAADPRCPITDVGLAYIRFAREHPALYRLMLGIGGEQSREAASCAAYGYAQLHDAIASATCSECDPIELEVTIVTLWCALHGLAELFASKDLEGTRLSAGRSESLVRAVLRQLRGVSARCRTVA